MNGENMSTSEKDIGVLSLEQIVRFAGAVQDFNPIHYDKDFAESMRMPAVVGQGPLAMSVALDTLVGEVGIDAIKGFGCRVTSPMFPDLDLEVVSEQDGTVNLMNGDTAVIMGKATPR